MLKYHYRYIDKKPREEGSDALVLGSAVHEALEVFYQGIIDTQTLPDAAEYKRIYKVFMDYATKEGLSSLDLYQEGKDMLTYCMDRASLEETVISVEQRFKLETERGTPFTGAIDKFLELDPKTIVVVDYKTSKTALTQGEADTDIQMSMYDLAVRKLYPQYETVVLVFDYVRLKSQVTSYRTAEQRGIFVDFIDSIYEGMEELAADGMKAKLNTFCGWCEFKAFCPEYARVITDKSLKVPKLEDLSDEDFVEVWMNFQDVRRIVERHKGSLNSQVHSRYRAGGGLIEGKEKEIFKVQNTKASYDVASLFSIVPREDLIKLVSPSVKAISKYMQNNPEYAEQIEKGASYSFNSPFFKTRNKQKSKG